jgi:hypothetical protein
MKQHKSTLYHHFESWFMLYVLISWFMLEEFSETSADCNKTRSYY